MPTRYPSEPSTRERVIAAAAELTAESGWASLTMGKLATRAGVSRQTVYNEIGTKPELGEVLVLTELAGFLQAVEAAFDAHPHDLVAAVRAAAYDVLVEVLDKPILQAIVGASHGAETELLPLLTTQAGGLMDLAKSAIRERTGRYDLDLPQYARDAALDTIVRLVFSHIMQPAPDAARAADDIAWVTGRMLGLAAPAR